MALCRACEANRDGAGLRLESDSAGGCDNLDGGGSQADWGNERGTGAEARGGRGVFRGFGCVDACVSTRVPICQRTCTCTHGLPDPDPAPYWSQAAARMSASEHGPPVPAPSAQGVDGPPRCHLDAIPSGVPSSSVVSR